MIVKISTKMGAFYTLLTTKTNRSCLLTTLNSSRAPQEPGAEVQKSPPNSAECLQLDKEQISILKAERKKKHIASFWLWSTPSPAPFTEAHLKWHLGVTESNRESKSHILFFTVNTCPRQRIKVHATDWDKKLAQVKISTPNLISEPGCAVHWASESHGRPGIFRLELSICQIQVHIPKPEVVLFGPEHFNWGTQCTLQHQADSNSPKQ